MKKKLKPLLPSLKEKKRYLAFKILSESKIKDFSAFSSAIWSSSLSFMGELGAADAGIWVLNDKYDAKNSTGIIRVNNRYVNELKASLALISNVEGQDVIIKTKKVSGILKKATADT